MNHKKEETEQQAKRRFDKDTMDLPSSRMKNLVQQTIPENARDTVPLNGPPAEWSVSLPPGEMKNPPENESTP